MNLQNLPAHDDRAARLKRGISPKLDAFLFADYMAMEFRIFGFYVAAQPSIRDYSIVDEFKRGEDPYTNTGKLILGREPTKDERNTYKRATLSLLYNGSWRTILNQGLATTEDEAQDIVDEIHRARPQINKLNQCVQRVMKDRGYVTTLWGRQSPGRTHNKASRFIAPERRPMVNYLIQGCLHPDTRVLTTDLRWLPIDEIDVGDELISYDEFPHAGKMRRARSATVLNRWDRQAALYAIELSDGTTIKATANHPWLVRTIRPNSQPGNHVWVRTDELTPKHQFTLFAYPWVENTTKEAGYVAGAFDGEGHVVSGGVGLTQRDNVLLKTVEGYLRNNSFSYSRYDRPPTAGFSGSKYDVKRVQMHGIPNVLKFLGTVRPARLLERSPMLWDGLARYIHHSARPTVVSVTPCGFGRVVDIETSTHTFIAEGFVTHNSASDIMKDAILNVSDFLNRGLYDSHCVLTIHDEIGLDCSEAEIPTIVENLPRLMSNARVAEYLPLDVDIEIARGSWSNAKPYETPGSPDGPLPWE